MGRHVAAIAVARRPDQAAKPAPRQGAGRGARMCAAQVTLDCDNVA